MELIRHTINSFFNERVKKTPNKVAIVFGDDAYTWLELDQISDGIALELLKSDVKKGTHVGIWSLNSPLFMLYFLALAKIGAVTVLINTRCHLSELEDLLDYADVTVLCYGEDSNTLKFLETIEQLDRKRLLLMKKIIAIGKNKKDIPAQCKKKLIEGDDLKLIGNAKKDVFPDDVLGILFTSGTTSAAKGVMLSHFATINIAIETVTQMHWNENDKSCLGIPLFHCFGLSSGFMAGIYAGIEIYLLENYQTIRVLKCVETNQCTIFNGVPTMFMAMIKHPRFKTYNLSLLNSGIIAGSYVNANDYLSICKELKMEKLQMSYGQTEASPSITFSDYEDTILDKSRSVGKVIPHVDLKILVSNQNEICIKGYNTMLGYYKLDEETKKAIDSEGWLHTGDLGYLDADGNLCITGRLKEMIVRGGENISPYEIENQIKNFPYVADVKVIGIEEEVLQEEIAACIVTDGRKKLNETEIREFLSHYLAAYKIPKYFIFLKKFPLNASGKIILAELKDQIKMIINTNKN
ncbi:AMP-binding protein [Acetobacterium woodii]|uniref:Caffeyl-CoA-synthetase CarB2 n=1 Tax=Acetobacterium woodii (strain ATCC 29683 / DSM 1030 / JCM 2381 / KCTC 1655 / WB1) TaxID=931626 RepID=H6LGM5_ACEWD|nr:AMP-binding protein [Acetobacterium woodii]AFA48353.1 caffeyl-CoA-synthetase CarB2 [Acetobacterium woodii DSM 1030]